MRRHPLVLSALIGIAACGSGEAAGPEPAATVGEVGRLPEALAPRTTEAVSAPSTTAEPTATTDDVPGSTTMTTTIDATDERVETVGRLIDGNRVLVIGDSILASISNRHGGQLCDRLVPRGWEVEVDAESGQHIEYGPQVLRRRLDAGWDAAVIMLGSNYGGDPVFYAAELGEMLDELGPRPVVLINVTEFRPDRAEVNYVIQSEATQRDDVRVLDWASRTRDADELLGADGLHLSELGREELAGMIATALGRAPTGSDGTCLRTP